MMEFRARNLIVTAFYHDIKVHEPVYHQAKTFLGANLKIRSDLFSAKREINFKPDKDVDNFNDYNPVSAPPIVQLPKPVRNGTFSLEIFRSFLKKSC